MSATLAISLVLATSSGPSATIQHTDGAQLLRDACVETGLQRAAFERLGRERRWRSQRIARRSGNVGWTVVFRADDARIMLTRGLAGDTDEPGLGASCSVSLEQASPGLEGEIAALAASLGLEDEAVVTNVAPGFVPIRVWSRFAGQTVTYAQAADGRAVISFSRQIVTHEPDAARAPVGP